MSARAPAPTAAPQQQNRALADSSDTDADVRRAHELLELHREVKQAYSSTGGSGRGSSLSSLHEARASVRRARKQLGLEDGVFGIAPRRVVGGRDLPDVEDFDEDEIAAWS